MGGGGQSTLSTFSTSCFGDFQIFGVNVEKIKRRKVQKVWVMDISTYPRELDGLLVACAQ